MRGAAERSPFVAAIMEAKQAPVEPDVSAPDTPAPVVAEKNLVQCDSKQNVGDIPLPSRPTTHHHPSPPTTIALVRFTRRTRARNHTLQHTLTWKTSECDTIYVVVVAKCLWLPFGSD